MPLGRADQNVPGADAIAGSERSAALRLICPGPEFQDVASWNFGTQKVGQVSYQAVESKTYFTAKVYIGMARCGYSPIDDEKPKVRQFEFCDLRFTFGKV
jgi:hypothetical protein